MIHALPGQARPRARRLLSSSRGLRRGRHYNMTSTRRPAWRASPPPRAPTTRPPSRCRELLARWERKRGPPLRRPGAALGGRLLRPPRRPHGRAACAEALARIASTGGHEDALAALAQAIGETALADGDAAAAAEQLARAVELHRDLDDPATSGRRSNCAPGVALAAAGEREEGLERLGDAYRLRASSGRGRWPPRRRSEVAALGESVAQRLGRRAAADAEGAGLTRRELEVVRLVAVGRTNREIAQELFLSQRTVDMHVRNMLGKLDCRSRVEAAAAPASWGCWPKGSSRGRRRCPARRRRPPCPGSPRAGPAHAEAVDVQPRAVVEGEMLSSWSGSTAASRRRRASGR